MLQPKKANIAGRITSGGFSLSLGRASAIAVVNLTAWLDMVERDHKLELAGEIIQPRMVLVRNRDGQVFRAAVLSLLD